MADIIGRERKTYFDGFDREPGALIGFSGKGPEDAPATLRDVEVFLILECRHVTRGPNVGFRRYVTMVRVDLATLTDEEARSVEWGWFWKKRGE